MADTESVLNVPLYLADHDRSWTENVFRTYGALMEEHIDAVTKLDSTLSQQALVLFRDGSQPGSIVFSKYYRGDMFHQIITKDDALNWHKLLETHVKGANTWFQVPLDIINQKPVQKLAIKFGDYASFIAKPVISYLEDHTLFWDNDTPIPDRFLHPWELFLISRAISRCKTITTFMCATAAVSRSQGCFPSQLTF